MALIYTKLTDKTTVLAPREGACRKFNFGDDWTEVRFGAFLTAVSSSGSNVDNTLETLVPANITDHVYFGLKNDFASYPGQAGSIFLGVRSLDSVHIQSQANSGIGDDSGTCRGLGLHDTTAVNGSDVNQTRFGSATASGSSAYCQFVAIKIVITNRGLATQSVEVFMTFEDNVAGSDYSATALRTAINNAAYGSMGSFAWNDGVAAREIPDCVWIRSPMYLNAFRVSAIRAIRYAP